MNKETPSAETAFQEVLPAAQAKRNTPFSQPQLQSAWLAATAHFKGLGSTPATALVMLEDVKVIVDNESEVTVQLKNKLYADALGKIKLELVMFLRKQLANDLLNLVPVIDEGMEEVAERVPFTAQERLRYLMENYPMMAQLKQKLELDLE